MTDYRKKYSEELAAEVQALTTSTLNVKTNIAQAELRDEAYFELLSLVRDMLLTFQRLQNNRLTPFAGFHFVMTTPDEQTIFDAYHNEYTVYFASLKQEINEIISSTNISTEIPRIQQLTQTLKNIASFHENPREFPVEGLVAPQAASKSRNQVYLAIALSVASTVTAFLGAFMVMLPMLAILVLPMIYLTYNLYQQYQANKPENAEQKLATKNPRVFALREQAYGVAGLFKQKKREGIVLQVEGTQIKRKI